MQTTVAERAQDDGSYSLDFSALLCSAQAQTASQVICPVA